MLIDYLFCFFQEIILIVDILFQIIIYQRLKSITLMFLIDGKRIFDLPVKNGEEAYKKIIGDNDYTTGNLLDYAYYKKHYKPIEKSDRTTFDFSQNSVTILWIMVTQKIVNLLNGFDNDNSEIIVKRRNAADTADVALGAITQVAIS